MTNIVKTTNNWPNKKFQFSAYYEKLQMQLVLLIILEPTKICLAETPESKVDYGGKRQRFAGRAGQHYLKYFHSTQLHSTPFHSMIPLQPIPLHGLKWA